MPPRNARAVSLPTIGQAWGSALEYGYSRPGCARNRWNWQAAPQRSNLGRGEPIRKITEPPGSCCGYGLRAGERWPSSTISMPLRNECANSNHLLRRLPSKIPKWRNGAPSREKPHAFIWRPGEKVSCVTVRSHDAGLRQPDEPFQRHDRVSRTTFRHPRARWVQGER